MNEPEGAHGAARTHHETRAGLVGPTTRAVAPPPALGLRRARPAALALVCAGVLASCRAEAPATGDTTETTRSLLTEPPSDGVSTPIVGVPAADPNAPDIPITELGFDRGSADAPVKVLEMSDYGCGYCRKFHLETFPTLQEEFIETGKIEWKFAPFVTGMFGNSLPATEAAECALEQGEQAFLALNERLWREQAEWKGSSDAAGLVRRWVDELDVEMTEFDACLAEDRRLPRIAAQTGLSRQLGVRGTPTFFVLGYPPLQGALPTDVFQEILTLVHADATRQGG